jgi:large subunit ribosomal protein L6
MSRIGKQIVEVPQGTTVTQNGDVWTVKGPKGELTKSFKDLVTITLDGDKITFAPKSERNNLAKALWGTYASHMINMIQGVNTPYEKKLIVEGVGYRVELQGKQLKLALGFSHDVFVDIPEGLDVVVEKNTITVTGIDKEEVGRFTANVRALKKPEPYKGKGIRYEGEVIRRKQGKKSV